MPKALELIALRASSPQFDRSQGEAGLPKRLLILAWGKHATTKGQVVCNETTMRELIAFNAAQNWDRPYLDFEHNSIPSSPTYQGEPCDIAARSDGLELVPGEGVYLVLTSLDNWTPSGRQHALAGNYPDLSPVVKVNERNEVIGLHSAALCRHGATPGLMFLSAAQPGKHAASTKAKAKSPLTSHLKLLTALKTPPQTADEFLAALREMLQLDAESTPEAVMTALSAAMGKEKPAETSDDMKQLSAMIATLTKSVTEQSETIKLLSANQQSSERGTILAEAVRAGKQIPKALAEKLDIASLKLLCAELPVTVPLTVQTPEGVKLLSADGTHIDPPELKEIDNLMGVSEDDRKKYLSN